jgi:DNA-binding IclR family transcriptional regulator
MRREDLERELDQVRRVGFATNFGESEDESVALAAAVQTIGCIVVTAPASRAKGRSWTELVQDRPCRRPKRSRYDSEECPRSESRQRRL